MLLFALVFAWAEMPPQIIDTNLALADTYLKNPSALGEQLTSNNIWKGVGFVGRSGAAIGKLDPRVIQCGSVAASPNWRAIEANLKSGRFKCLKIFLGFVPYFANDPYFKKAYRLAQTYDVPVAFHTGDTSDAKTRLKYADPLTVDDVAVDYPKVRFIIHHAGNPWIQSAAEVAYKNPNVWLDGSALLTGDLDTMAPEKVDEFVVKPLRWIFGYMESPDKLLFGSHWPASPIASYIHAYQRAIPKEHWKAVFFENAAKVFRLDSEGKR